MQHDLLHVHRTRERTDADTFSAGRNFLEEKLPELHQAVQDCHEAVRKAAEERTAAWEQWKAAHEESGSSRLLRQHMRAEQQLQQAVNSAMGHMQVAVVIHTSPVLFDRVFLSEYIRNGAHNPHVFFAAPVTHCL